MKTKEFNCCLSWNDDTSSDWPTWKNKVVATVRSPQFDDMVRGLSLAAMQIKQGPTPRAVEGGCHVGVGGNIGGGGGVNVSGGCHVRF